MSSFLLLPIPVLHFKCRSTFFSQCLPYVPKTIQVQFSMIIYSLIFSFCSSVCSSLIWITFRTFWYMSYRIVFWEIYFPHFLLIFEFLLVYSLVFICNSRRLTLILSIMNLTIKQLYYYFLIFRKIVLLIVCLWLLKQMNVHHYIWKKDVLIWCLAYEEGKECVGFQCQVSSVFINT
jgi:hypothetical protein